MMAELYARGPIACGVAVTKDFVAYTGGIFNDTTNSKVGNYYNRSVYKDSTSS